MKEAALALGISESTVKGALERLRRRLDATNTTHSLLVCFERGFLVRKGSNVHVQKAR